MKLAVQKNHLGGQILQKKTASLPISCRGINSLNLVRVVEALKC